MNGFKSPAKGARGEAAAGAGYVTALSQIQRASRKLSDEHPKKKFGVPSSAHADCQWWIKHINTPDKILIPELTCS
ncbi:unnamed protein product, partial [Iphiclides podalirius]